MPVANAVIGVLLLACIAKCSNQATGNVLEPNTLELQPPSDEPGMSRSDFKSREEKDNIALTMSHQYTELSAILLAADPEGFRDLLIRRITELDPHAVMPEIIDSLIASLQHPSINPDNFQQAVQTYLNALAAHFNVRMGLEQRSRVFGRVGEDLYLLPQDFVDAVNSDIIALLSTNKFANDSRFVARITELLAAVAIIFTSPCCIASSTVGLAVSCSSFALAFCYDAFSERLARESENQAISVVTLADTMIDRKIRMDQKLQRKYTLNHVSPTATGS